MPPQESRSNRAKSTLAAVAIAFPLFAASPDARAQDSTDVPNVGQDDTTAFQSRGVGAKAKSEERVEIVGVVNGRIIYMNQKGGLFYLDPVTGDMRFIDRTDTSDSTMTLPPLAEKGRPPSDYTRATRGQKSGGGRYVTIIGTDTLGRVLHRTSNGDVFYLDPVTGDMVFLPDTTKKGVIR